MEKIYNKRVLITGGLGMIGSVIASKLIEFGAEVTIVDAMIKPFGGNLFNIHHFKDKINLNITDIRDQEAMKILVQNKDIIFNLAGQVSHNDSLLNPFLDTDINYIGHLTVLEAVKNFNPQAKILYSGSRLQFGKIEQIPVSENHPLNPLTPYAVNKTAAENLYLYYHRAFNIPVVIFRIANPYGPKCQMQHSKYSIVNWFIRNAFDDKEIVVFGDGDQIRDYIYVEDLADVFISAAINDQSSGEIFNIGSGVGTKFLDMVNAIVDIVGKGKIKKIPWPDDYQNVETGNYITDISKVKNKLDWKPVTSLSEGIQKTVKFYKHFGENYW